MPRRRPPLVLCAALACNSDDPFAAEESTGGGTTTTGAVDPTTSGASSTSTGDDPTTTGDESSTGAPGPTCRDILMCVGMCALTLDLQCFQGCADGLDPEEGQKALELGVCIAGACFESGACTPQTLQDPLCLACIGLGVLGNAPPGCEDQADACM
jgi:hypothetical protein